MKRAEFDFNQFQIEPAQHSGSPQPPIASLQPNPSQQSDPPLPLLQPNPSLQSSIPLPPLSGNFSLQQDLPIQSSSQQFDRPLQREQPQNFSNNEFLSKIYNEPYQFHEPQEEFQTRIQQKRQLLTLYNTINHPYTRAHHYHFLLDQFERVPGQRSYAIDRHNQFLNTFLQQHKLYKGHRLNQIINRIAFTLPVRGNEEDCFLHKKPGNSHNEAHAQLFNIENAKYALDRTLLTFKIVLNKLEQFTTHQLKQFQLINNNKTMQFLLMDSVPLKEKQRRLSEAITNIQTIKSQETQPWAAHDALFFPSSLQQKLHDYQQQDERIEERRAPRIIANFIVKYKKALAQLNKQVETFHQQLTKMMSYYKTFNCSLSEDALLKLQSFAEIVSNPQRVQLPLLVFNFGSSALRNKTDIVIINYLKNHSSESEQNLAMLLQKLFKSDTDPSKEIQFLDLKSVKALAIKKLKEVKEHNEHNLAAEVPYLDEYVDLQTLEKENDSAKPAPLIKLGAFRIPVREQEAKVIIYYQRICRTLSLFEPILHQNDQLLKVLCSLHLDTLLLGIMGHIPKKNIAKLKYNLRSLIEHSPFLQMAESAIDSSLQFQFNPQTGLGLLWYNNNQLPNKQEKGKDLTFFINQIPPQQPSPNPKEQQDQQEKQLAELQQFPLPKKVKQNQQPQ